MSLAEKTMEHRNVTIASSSKFYDRVRSVLDILQSHGLTCYTPAFDFDETKVVVSQEQKYHLTWAFLDKIRASDVLFVIDTDGYTGTSVCIEIGYAYALQRPIYAIEPPSELAIAALITRVIDVTDLANMLSPMGKNLDKRP
jgi:nucleoside 2-deoxyribosyltransferase